MPNSSILLKRFESGGSLTINDGTTTLTIKAIEPGTLEHEPGFYEPLEWTDRGNLMTPFEGDARPGRLKLNGKFTGWAQSGDVPGFMLSRDTTTGLMKLYTVTVKIPDVKDGLVGDQGVFANCFLPAGGLKYKAGAKFDMWDLEMVNNEVKPTWTRY